ncbi:MAG: glycosyltransferase [Acidimicrobiales bacterium]
MRVLRIIARMNVGGPALQVETLQRGLATHGIESRLLVGQVGPGEEEWANLRSSNQDLVARVVPGLGREPNAGGDVRALGVLMAEIRRFRPHIVHTHTAKAGMLGRLAAGLCRVPATVHTFHGHLLTGYFSAAVTRAITVSERIMAPGTDRLVAVGARVRDELLEAGVGRPAQYRVVAPGVVLPPAPDRVRARLDLGLPEVGPAVGLVARLTQVKRPDRFVDMARAVAVAHPDAVFIVAGDGPLAPVLKSAAQEFDGRLRLLGWQSDLARAYAACDLVVLTSDNEGMPVSLIEAAHAGRPAVTTDVGGAAEVVEHGVTGLVVEPDAQALAKAVTTLLADPTRRHAMGRAAQARAATLFTPDRLVADHVSLYRELVAAAHER